MKDRIISSHLKGEDVSYENNLRPQKLEEFIGQDKLKEKLSIYIQAAKERREPLDHVLLHGPPGLGKTTLSLIISKEMGVDNRITSGPAIERPGDLAALLTNLTQGDVLFIDEIHRLHRTVEEILYPAMEDFALDIIIGKGPSARSLRLDLSPFTLVGATTRAGLISAPLRDRFGIVERVEFYTTEALRTILERSSRLLGVEILDGGLEKIALAARGTPRIANRLLRRVRDFAQVKAGGSITAEVATEALQVMEVDGIGLDRTDYLVLETIIRKFTGGPVGVETIAAAINEEPDSIEEIYEPYLMKIGFLKRTPRGRIVTAKAYRHLGLEAKEYGQQHL
jgi:Holliday junction DNA helicase RuvB